MIWLVFKLKKYTSTFLCHLDGLALQQGEVKGHSIEESLTFEALKGSQAADRCLAQKLARKMFKFYKNNISINRTESIENDADNRIGFWFFYKITLSVFTSVISKANGGLKLRGIS